MAPPSPPPSPPPPLPPPLPLLLLLLLLGASLHARPGFAQPTLGFPIASQLPPVARVNEPFRWQFAPQTFASSPPGINHHDDGGGGGGTVTSYRLDRAPAWLQLDSSTRTFSGTPSPADEGPVDFELVAVTSGGLAQSHVSLRVVSLAPPAPLLHNVAAALASASGVLSAPDTLSLYPSDSFHVPLGTQSFGAYDGLVFYATSSDRSPLPPWIQFDARTVSLAGTSPFPAPSPRLFGVSVLASRFPGFAEAQIDFALDISNHVLAFRSLERTVVVPQSAAGRVSEQLLDGLLLDQKPVDAADIVAVQVNDTALPLTVDPHTLVLSGTLPDGLQRAVAVSVQDIYSNNATIVCTFDVASALTSQDLGQVDAARGRLFRYQFSPSLLEPVDASMTVDIGALPWLAFDSANLILHGIVPASVALTTFPVQVSISSRSLGTNETRTLAIRTVDDAGSTTSSTEPDGAVSSGPVSSSLAADSRGARDPGHGLGAGAIAAAVIVPVIVCAALLMVVFCYCCGRSRRRGQNAEAGMEKRSTMHQDQAPVEVDARHDDHNTNSSSWQTEDSRTLPSSHVGPSGLFGLGLPGPLLGISGSHGQRDSSMEDGELETLYSLDGQDDHRPQAVAVPELPRVRPRRLNSYRRSTGSRPMSRVDMRQSDDSGGSTTPAAAPCFDRRRILPGVGHGRISRRFSSSDSIMTGDNERRHSHAASSMLLSGSRSSDWVSSHRTSMHSQRPSRADSGRGIRKARRKSTLEDLVQPEHAQVGTSSGGRQRQSHHNPFFASAASREAWNGSSRAQDGRRSRPLRTSAAHEHRQSWVQHARRTRGDSWQEGFPRVIATDRASSRYSMASLGSLFADVDIASVGASGHGERQARAGVNEDATAIDDVGNVSQLEPWPQGLGLGLGLGIHPLRMGRTRPSTVVPEHDDGAGSSAVFL